MTTWFTSDTHFGHANIIKYCNRPFKDAEEMNEILIQNWNSVVKDGDFVYHLGDFAMGVGDEGKKNRFSANIRRRLNGEIDYILGNHDPNWTKEFCDCHGTPVDNPGFLRASHYQEVRVHGQKIILFHYGMRTWHHDLRGVWQVYGHSHTQLKPYGKSCDVGVDEWNFTPVSFDQLKAFMDNREIGDHPMFSEYKPTVEV